jgi:hypothetical protein
MRGRMLGLVCVLGIGVATPAIAYRVVFDAGLAGTTSANYVSVARCGMTVFFPSSAGVFLLGGGLGVGASGTTIENGEEVVVTLPAASLGVSYSVSTSTNSDGDGLFGESYVEAFDADDATLGVLAMSALGTKNLTNLFGGVPIKSYQITGGDDPIRVQHLGYELPEGIVVNSYLAVIGAATVSESEFTQCGITFRGSPGAAYLDSNGISVAGGNADVYVDGDEDLEIEFDTPVTGAGYTLDDATNVNGGTLGGHFVEAFDRNGASLGLRSASGLDPIDLSTPSYFGDEPISRFVLIGVADQFRLGRVNFVPEPAGAAVTAALALASLGAARRRSRRLSAR